MRRVSGPLSTQSSSVSSSSTSSSGRHGQRRCRAAYALIRQLPGHGDRAGEQSRVLTACPGEARRTVYQLDASAAELSIVGSKTMISSSALLLRFEGQYWPLEVAGYRLCRYRYEIDIFDPKYRRHRCRYRYPFLQRSTAYSYISLSPAK